MNDEYGPIESLSPQQARERANALTKQAERLREQSMQLEIGAAPGGKASGSSKKIINISFIVFGVTGIVGSFWDKFDMSKYVEFLQVFAYIWAPLVVAVGGGMAVKNFVTKKYGAGE